MLRKGGLDAPVDVATFAGLSVLKVPTLDGRASGPWEQRPALVANDGQSVSVGRGNGTGAGMPR